MKRQQSFTNDKPSLFVIATPIGNLQEISKRCIEVLESVDCVFCEDTRVSSKIMQHLSIKKSLYSAFENKELEAAANIISMLKNNKNVALVSDAGYPGISDPGQKIIKKVIDEDFNVVVINGPSALIQSVIASGFSTDHFYFYGFLDAKPTRRKKELEKLKDFEDTLIFYQSPHKIKESLQDFLEVFGNRNICLCRELTKKFEEYIRGTVSEVLEICESLKGEMVLVVEGKKTEKRKLDESVIDLIDLKIKEGKTTNQAIKEVAKELDLSKNEVYDFYHIGG